jgi:hypothetical protein
MQSMGDFYAYFYAIALHDPQLRAGLVAMYEENRAATTTRTRGARSSVATALRAFAALIDAPRPSVPAERLPDGAT